MWGHKVQAEREAESTVDFSRLPSSEERCAPCLPDSFIHLLRVRRTKTKSFSWEGRGAVDTLGREVSIVTA